MIQIFGRFLNADGILGNPGEINYNLYCYCGNTFINSYDEPKIDSERKGGELFIHYVITGTPNHVGKMGERYE